MSKKNGTSASLLTSTDIINMMNEYKDGVRPKELAEAYGISVSQVNQIRRRCGIDARYRDANRVVEAGAIAKAKEALG